MKRRDVLLLRVGPINAGPINPGFINNDATDRPARLSCEQLYMRFVDAEAEGEVDRFFDRLERELNEAIAVQVTDRSWLAREDLKERVDGLLKAFVARGGRVS